MNMNNKNLCPGCFDTLPENTAKCPHCGYQHGEKAKGMAFSPETKLTDRFLVGNVVETSGEGIIYQGYDLVNDTKVVIKEYFPGNLASRAAGSAEVVINPGSATQYKALLSDYIDLAKTLHKLNGLSCLVDTVDVFEANNTAYAVLSNFQGVSLEDFLSKTKTDLKWADAKEIFYPLLSSIRILHEANVIHRGICPQNIIVNKNGDIKLVDFYISSARTEHSELKAEIFDGYAAPEQYRQNGWQGNWTDVYGIAATIYRVLTGMVPASANSRAEDDKLLSVSLINKDVPKYISNAIANALAVSPKQRTKSVDLFLSDLSNKENVVVREGDNKVSEKKPERKFHLNRNLKYAMISFAATTVVLVILLSIIYSLTFGANVGVISSTSSVSESPVSVSGTTMAAPTFVGKTIAEIMGTNQYTDNFEIKYSEAYDPNIAVGVVISQDPSPGAEVQKGSAVQLTVSKGPQKVKMPDVVGMTLEQAKKTLDDLGILYQTFNTYDVNTPAGSISRTNKNVGDEISAGVERISLFVSTYTESSSGSGSAS